MISSAPALSIENRVRMPVSAWQHAGFRRWISAPDFPDGVRASFVEGEVFIEMSPDKIESHNKVKTAVTVALGRLVQDEDLGELYSDRALLSHEGASLSTEPDVLFASWETLNSGKLRKVPSARGGDFTELEGSPDLVVEVVSDSSERKDTERLREAYARAGIAEYWIIDARGAEPRYQILTLAGDQYQAASSSPEQHSAVFGRRFALRRDTNRAGYWRYRLEQLG